MGLFRSRIPKQRTAPLVILVCISMIFPAKAMQADEPPTTTWVLTETLVNPENAPTEFYGGGKTPNWFGEPRFEGKHRIYRVSETSFSIDDREVDHGYEYHNVNVQVSFQAPPAELVVGETVELAASFSHSGAAEDAGFGVQFWYSGEGVKMQPPSAFGYAPWQNGFDGTSAATWTFEVPSAYSDGEEIEIYASLWNEPPCLVVWKYRAVVGEEEKQPEGPREEETPDEDEVRKPVIVLPGIYGSYLASSFRAYYFSTWEKYRGLAPDLLRIDPLSYGYDDILQTLKNAGYVEGEDLFAGAYDWRLPPGPFDGTYDGVIGGLSGVSITDDLYEYGVDYLGYYLKQAAEKWRQNHDGEILDSVDIIAHSTGGLVARVYVQGTAYGQHFRASDGAAVPLPKVDNLIMVAVPNRGAALPWQAMHNNFIRDAASKYVMGRIIAFSYLKVQQGSSIEGPPAPITAESIRDPATGTLDPVRFINLYCPTFRSLLATYPFIVKQDGSLVDVNGSPEVRNDLVLDLNNGFDLPGRPASADPNLFASAVGHTTVFYAEGEETAYQMREMNTAAENAVFPMDATFEQDVADGTTWYQDIAAKVGDGTVPALSAAGQFQGDGRIDVFVQGSGNTTHTGLMVNPMVQTIILNVLGIDAQGVEISTGLAEIGDRHLIAALSDPVAFLLIDGEGRRLGWTPETGVLAEIPNSAWYGDGDGIGFVFGEVSQPLRVELVGLGEDHIVQVVGQQGEQRIGLKDGSPLASGETKSVDVEVRDRVSPPSLTVSPASESDDSADLLLIGVVIVLYTLIALVLVALVLALARRRRRV